ncbi:MFS transporter [Nakamurella antarctica]|uniref:MFS transporter n=2 Tax=Nakamurella antarctica TaxID=1902245 RepID=A0A3G8ZSA4_9ACTN|nr:MFS transporter [Nakamurella antarctica]
MAALMALLAFESLAVTTAMPVIAEDLNGLALYSMAFAGTLAASVVGMVVAGQASDRGGLARPLWAGLALFIAGLVIAGTAVWMPVLVLGRLVQGLGSGALSVILYVMVARVYPLALRPKIFAAFAAAWVVPALIGPFIAGLVVEHLHWRWVFFGAIMLALPAAFMIRGAANRSQIDIAEVKARTPADHVKVLLAIAASASVVLLHFGGQQTGVVAIIALAVGIAGLVMVVPRLLPHGTVTASPGIPAAIALRAVAGAGFTVAEVFLPLLLIRERGLTPGMAGLVLTAAALTWSTGSWLRGRSSTGHQRYLAWGSAAIAVAIIAAALPLWPHIPIFVAVIGWAVGGLGMGLVYPTLSLLTLELSPVSQQGANSSALQLAEALSTATFLAVTGFAFALLITATPVAAYLACFGLAVLLALVSMWIARRVLAAPSPVTVGAATATEPG